MVHFDRPHSRDSGAARMMLSCNVVLFRRLSAGREKASAALRTCCFERFRASHDMIGREMAGGFLADFDLQGRMPDAKTLPQLARRPQEEFVPGMTSGKHEMRGQRIFSRAQGPDVQIVHGG